MCKLLMQILLMYVMVLICYYYYYYIASITANAYLLICSLVIWAIGARVQTGDQEVCFQTASLVPFPPPVLYNKMQ